MVKRLQRKWRIKKWAQRSQHIFLPPDEGGTCGKYLCLSIAFPSVTEVSRTQGAVTVGKWPTVERSTG